MDANRFPTHALPYWQQAHERAERAAFDANIDHMLRRIRHPLNQARAMMILNVLVILERAESRLDRWEPGPLATAGQAVFALADKLLEFATRKWAGLPWLALMFVIDCLLFARWISGLFAKVRQ